MAMDGFIGLQYGSAPSGSVSKTNCHVYWPCDSYCIGLSAISVEVGSSINAPFIQMDKMLARNKTVTEKALVRMNKDTFFALIILPRQLFWLSVLSFFEVILVSLTKFIPMFCNPLREFQLPKRLLF